MEDEHEPARTPPVVSSQTPPPPPPPESEQPPEFPPHAHGRELGPAFYLKFAALLFFVGYAIAFVVGNDKTISVDFVFATGDVSLIAGVLLAHLYRRHGRKQVRQP